MRTVPVALRDVWDESLAIENIGAPRRIRTSDPQIRSLMLYPAELPVQAQ